MITAGIERQGKKPGFLACLLRKELSRKIPFLFPLRAVVDKTTALILDFQGKNFNLFHHGRTLQNSIPKTTSCLV
ncbi:MAG TPA: hypothetical protein VGB38_05980 [bacterium]